MHAKPEVASSAAAGIQIATRQALFDYAAQHGLEILKAKVQDIQLPDISKTVQVPLAGDFEVRLYNLKVVNFTLSIEDAKLIILDSFFNLWVNEVGCKLSFRWHWEKTSLGIEGTGDGELTLSNGILNYVFDVAKDTLTDRPKLDVQLADSYFESAELSIESFSANWFYQAVLALFNDRVSSLINKGIAKALSDDVPNAINDVLSTLPTRIDIKGLPFTTAFDYSIYTLSYVLVKGYGEVEMPEASQLSHSTTAMQQLPAVAALALQRCPLEASELPVPSETIALDPHMLTLYLHESMLNCMGWAMFNVGVLKYSIVDGTIPNLHLITDLLANLIPELPRAYPRQQLRIDVEAGTAPKVSFSATGGFTLSAIYRTTLYVNNETLGVPLVAQLDCNLTITGFLSWDTTSVTSVVARHVLVYSPMAVPTAAWDNTVAWFIQNYAGLYPLQMLVNTFVQTPVTSMAALVNAQGTMLDGWFVLSGDVQLLNAAALAS